MHVLPLAAMVFLLGCETKPPANAQHAPTSAQQAPSGRPLRPLAAQQAPAQVQKAPLCLELQASGEPVQLGEPLSLVVSLINCSREAQQVDDLLSPEFGFLQLWIQPPDGKELLYRPISKREGRGKGTRSLAPGERLSALAPIYASADGWTMMRPGRYGFRAQYSVEAAKLESKPTYVTVAPPQTETDRNAANIIMSREVGWFLTTGRDDNGEASKRLTAIIEQYPQSRLAGYARIGIAVAESRGGFDPATKTFRRGGCERASESLARAPEISDPSLASAGTAAWIRCLRQMGRDKEVSGAISTFMRRHPAARDVTTVNQMLGVTRQESR